MAKRLRKTLPKNFPELVEAGDLAAFKDVFERSDINAYLGHSRNPALATYGISDEMVRWLVDRGADIQARNSYGETPLHHHAGAWNGNPALLLELGAEPEARDERGETPLFDATSHPDHLRTLIAAGAEVDTRNELGMTPMDMMLLHCRSSEISRSAAAATLLIGAGAEITLDMKAEVLRIGTDFEHLKPDFNPDSVAETAAALTQLYQLFEVDAAPTRVRHDGHSVITVQATDWQEQFTELWYQLVPGTGPAPTIQGEVIRIVARLNDEINNNGGVNWDREYRAMVSALPGYLEANGMELKDEEHDLLRGMCNGEAETTEINQLAQLCTRWVLANPQPKPMGDPDYRR